MPLLEDATHVLLSLAAHPPEKEATERGRETLSGDKLREITGLSPERLNDATSLLQDNGYAKLIRALGSHPYEFVFVELTPRGRLEAERLSTSPSSSKQTSSPTSTPPLQRSPVPVGSPYGFTEQDWATVAVDRADATRLNVCLGLQWRSEQYDMDELAKNVQGMFEVALKEAIGEKPPTARLAFKKLQGGYGSHLFNEIARDIIAADIAVFDTSDLNPNVMIELGVALTWGTAVLPIRSAIAPKPPSDISGQTWAEYSANGLVWTDSYHSAKLAKMVEFALRRKGSL